jgi:hypothetical protein
VLAERRDTASISPLPSGGGLLFCVIVNSTTQFGGIDMAAKKMAPANKMAASKKQASAANSSKKEAADKKRMNATKKKMDADKQANPGSYTFGRAAASAMTKKKK